MIQLEFETIREIFPNDHTRLRLRLRVRKGTKAIDYTIRLSSALRVVNLTHPLYDVLCAVAALQIRSGHATIPQVFALLGCTYYNVCLHILRNPELFDEIEGSKPRAFVLTPAAIELMGKIKRRIQRHES
jgi:hypothetical protein